MTERGQKKVYERSRKIGEELAKICTRHNGEGKLYRKGEIIYQPGDIDDSLYYIKEGKVKLAYLDESGRKLTLAILGAGEIFGEMVLIGQRRRELLAQVLQDARIYEIERERFMQLIQQKPWLVLEVLELFGQRTLEIQQKLEDLVFKDITTRLSRQLLRLIEEHGQRTEEGIRIDFKITHKELADLIGSARENTTSALNLLEKEGILDKRRYQIIIKNEEKLKEKSKNL